MSASMIVNMDQNGWLARHGQGMELPPGRPARERAEDDFLGQQVTVVRGMLATLETLSAAGQHHLMNKIVAFIQSQSQSQSQLQAQAQVAHASADADPRQDSFAKLLADLNRESDRPWPIARRFEDCAARLLSVLVDC